MSIKIKTVFENDIRVFKSEANSIGTIFTSLKNFISSSYGIREFTLQYLDEENDYVTIGSNVDLQDGIEYSQVMGQLLKVYIKTSSQDPVTTNITCEKSTENKSNVEEKEKVNVEEKEKVNVEEYHLCGLMNELINNEKFREEFISFVTTILLLLREDQSYDLITAFTQAAAAHESVSSHPQIAMIGSLLPIIAPQIQPFMIFVTALDPSMVSGLISQIVKAAQGDKTVILPPWLGVLGTQFHAFSSGSVCSGISGQCGISGSGFDHGYGGEQERGHDEPKNSHDKLKHGHNVHEQGEHGWNGNSHGSFCESPKPWSHHPHPHPHPHPHHPHHFGHHGPHPHHPHPHHPHPHHPHPHHFGHHPHHPNGFGPGRGSCRFKKLKDLRVDILDDNVTLADRAFVLPKQSIIKTWKVKNSGEIDWSEGTSIVYFGKPFNPMVNGVKFPVKPLKVNEEGEISIVLESPQELGHYGSRWKLIAPNGEHFGRMFFARINVVEDIEPNSNVTNQKMDKLLSKREKLQSKLEKLQKKLKDNNIEVDTSSSDENSEEKKIDTGNDNSNNNINDNNIINNNINDNNNNSNNNINDNNNSNNEINDNNDSNDNKNKQNPIDISPKEENGINSGSEHDFDIIDVPYAKEIQILLGMGYGDEKLLGLLLQEHKGDVGAVIEVLN